MFSDNQILDITGEFSQLEEAITFAMTFSDNLKDFTKSEYDRGCRIVYQITEDGRYCLGWGFEDIPEGWTEYQFRPDINIISLIIKQHLEKNSLDDYGFDGISECGFRMKNINSYTKGIVNSDYGIVYFEPYTCLYGK